MDKEQIRQGLEKKLKGLGVPQEDIDKALLDYDTLASDIDDVKALERFGEQLVENVSYKNNIAPDDGMEEYRKIFPEVWGTEPPSDKDIEDFLNEEIKKEIDDNQKTSDADGLAGVIDRNTVPAEELLNDYGANVEMPASLDDIKNSNPYSQMKTIKGWVDDGLRNSKFGEVILNRYDIYVDFIENTDLSPEQKEKLLKKVNDDIINLDEKYKKIVVQTDLEMSLEDMNKMEGQLASDIADYEAILQSDADKMKIAGMDASTERGEQISEIMDWEEASQNTADWPPDDPKEWGIEKYYEKFETDEFDEIIQNEKSTNWWRYDGSSPEHQDYMERYTSGDLTEEEIADLKAQDEAFNKDVDVYDKAVDGAADANGITDKQSWKNLVMAGTKLLQLVDEEIIYAPAILAQKGLAALGIPGAALAGKGINLAIMYEDILFKANVAMAALAHGGVALEGAIERAPELPQKISNAILGLYGVGMPQGLVPEQETPISDASKEAQAAKHKEYFYNQMYQYSRMSPSLRFFTDVVGPKTGVYDQIGVLKKVAGLGKGTGTEETRSYNQFGVNE